MESRQLLAHKITDFTHSINRQTHLSKLLSLNYLQSMYDLMNDPTKVDAALQFRGSVLGSDTADNESLSYSEALAQGVFEDKNVVDYYNRVLTDSSIDVEKLERINTKSGIKVDFARACGGELIKGNTVPLALLKQMSVKQAFYFSSMMFSAEYAKNSFLEAHLKMFSDAVSYKVLQSTNKTVFYVQELGNDEIQSLIPRTIQLTEFMNGNCEFAGPIKQHILQRIENLKTELINEGVLVDAKKAVHQSKNIVIQGEAFAINAQIEPVLVAAVELCLKSEEFYLGAIRTIHDAKFSKEHTDIYFKYLDLLFSAAFRPASEKVISDDLTALTEFLTEPKENKCIGLIRQIIYLKELKAINSAMTSNLINEIDRILREEGNCTNIIALTEELTNVISQTNVFYSNPNNYNIAVQHAKLIEGIRAKPWGKRLAAIMSGKKISQPKVKKAEHKKFADNMIVSPLAEYLNDSIVQKTYQENIEKYPIDKNISDISRYFNDLAIKKPYHGVESLHNIIEDVMRNDELNAFIDYTQALALNDLFDINGDMREDVYKTLNAQGALDNLKNKGITDHQLKSQILSAYLMELIRADELIIKLADLDTEYTKNNSKALPPSIKLGQALNKLSASIILVDKQTMAKANAQLLSHHPLKSKKLEGAIDQLISPFARFLRADDIQNAIAENYHHQIRPHLTDDGKISRLFNHLPAHYMNIAPLCDTLEDAIQNNKIENWFDFVEYHAMNDLFDENGEFKLDVYDALNIKYEDEEGRATHALDKLIETFGWEVVKMRVLAAYIESLSEAEAIKSKLNELNEKFVQQAIGGHGYQDTLPDNKRDNDVYENPAVKFFQMTNERLNHTHVSIDQHLDYIDEKIVKCLKHNPNGHLETTMRKFIDANYDKALDHVNESLEGKKSIKTKIAGLFRTAFNTIVQLVSKIKNKHPEATPKLTRTLQSTNKVICNPSPRNIKHFSKHASKMKQYSWGAVLGAVMLSTVGILVIAATIGLAVVSHGATIPVTAHGIMFGVSLISTGFAIGTGVGLGSLAAGSYLGLFKAKKHVANDAAVVAMAQERQNVKTAKKQ